jgi:hypothetical protein
MPEIMLSSVVLPLPEGPTMNSISPKWATSATSFTAVTLVSPSPNHFVTPVATIAWLPSGVGIVGGHGGGEGGGFCPEVF